ncbi:TerC family protein [Candidatus Puniceispirillum sp.]|nr:TerC family protein [Candidatus Puniceispirillum sp.]
MEIIMGMSAEAFAIALLQIIAIDIILGGDNAIVIALACRNLPPEERRIGILWGTAGAIVLRVILVFFASALMTTPGLRLIGGLLLLWIGVKLLTDTSNQHFDKKIAQKSNLLGAIKTIIIADFVMSLDNALAIAAASKGNLFLVVFGLVLSVPIIIAGSTLILRMMERFPFIILIGAGLLGWLGGDLIANDSITQIILPETILQTPWVIASLGTGIVIGFGKLLMLRRSS